MDAIATRGTGTATQPAPPSGAAAVLGTGLPLWLFVALTLASVALFLVWGGPLWSAPREASHVVRFAVSYLAVVPAAAAALLTLKRLDVARLLTAIGTIWSIKLLVTAVLFLSLARGTATRLDPKPLPPPAGAPAVAMTTPPGAAPPATAIDRAPANVVLELRDGAYARPLYTARPWDALSVANHDARLHTVHLRSDARVLGNVPVRAAGVAGPTFATLKVPGPGTYDVGCDAHPGEHTRLVVSGTEKR